MSGIVLGAINSSDDFVPLRTLTLDEIAIYHGKVSQPSSGQRMRDTCELLQNGQQA